uniref:Uncharacterized protein n=1 Tax=Steinernema glaseri TaxID=37863 RepID=A0A1I7YW39_9BILA
MIRVLKTHKLCAPSVLRRECEVSVAVFVIRSIPWEPFCLGKHDSRVIFSRMNLFHNASFVAVIQTVVLLMLINSKTASAAPRERLRLLHPYANTLQQLARLYPNRQVMSFQGHPAERAVYFEPVNEVPDSYYQETTDPEEEAPPAAPVLSGFWTKRNVLKKLALQGARGFGK